MPTSARKVRGLSGWSIRIIPPSPPLRSRGDVGIAPYAFRRVLPLNEARPNIAGAPHHTCPVLAMKAPAGGHLSPRLRWLGAAETDEEKKPSPGRGWQGEALTGVGRCRVGLGTAPLPAPGGQLPPGEGWRAAGSRPPVFPIHPGLPRKRWSFPLIRQGPWP